MSDLVLSGAVCRLRPYRASDIDALHHAADDELVARWMSATFPHPYTRADAEAWLAVASADTPPHHFAVEADGEFAGGIGFMPLGGELHGRERCVARDGMIYDALLYVRLASDPPPMTP